MAAKPPKPPGKFLKQLNDCLSNNTKNNNSNTKNLNKANSPVLNKIKRDDNANESSPSGSLNEISTEHRVNGNNNPISAPAPAPASTTTTTLTPASATKSNCSCTNISIIHLFHEMKQKFPTIPDTIVAQCVNENCHQREHCIQQLRNELALNPTPAQSYPAKVLYPTQRQQSVPKTPITPITPNTGPLKPTRPAPVQPSPNQIQQKVLGLPISTSIQQQQKVNCDSISSVTNTNINNNCNKNISKPRQCNPNNNNSVDKDVENNIGLECAKTETTNTPKSSDMPTTTKSLTTDSDCDSVSETRLTPLTENRENVSPNQVPSVAPRTRPTTLNLQTQVQQQQRQQINIQLQKHFQQRNHQQQQQQQQQHQLQQQQQTKPLRKAPLPPIPPKPVQFVNAGAHSPQFHHNNHNNNNNNNNVNNKYGLTHSQQSSFSNDSSLTSPTSSTGESEISVNVSLSSPIVGYQAVATSPASSTALKSPIRHRSVITVHPEPPYTKDFVGTPTTAGNPILTGTPGQKSFTSVNLTLRQPNTNSSIPASTIDISAGPGLSGNNSGLTYSSTSYDARRGYQKNFHITVTDQGGVFSASHIRPRSCFYPGGDYEQEGSNSPTSGNNINPLRTATSEQCVAQHLQHNNTQQHQQQQLQNIVASSNITTALSNNEMCVPGGHDVLTETLDRQKTRRDKLATALRDNKKRLDQVEQEINVLTEPIRPEESIRLDEDINILRCECQAMLNEIDAARRSVVPSLPNINNESSNNRQPQPFPRQRPHRTSTSGPSPLATSVRQPQLDFVQHHSNATTPNPSTPHTFNSPHQQAPPTYQEYCRQYPEQALHMPLTDEEDYTDTDVDEDYDEEPLQPWACNMCTFRNHPQLNICECCENVRIQPGTIRIVPTAAVGTSASATVHASATPTPTNANNNVANSLDNDANLTQQQFALPT